MNEGRPALHCRSLVIACTFTSFGTSLSEELVLEQAVQVGSLYTSDTRLSPPPGSASTNIGELTWGDTSQCVPYVCIMTPVPSGQLDTCSRN